MAQGQVTLGLDLPDLVAEFKIAFCVTLSKVPSQFKRFEHNHLEAEFSGIILYHFEAEFLGQVTLGLDKS